MINDSANRGVLPSDIANQPILLLHVSNLARYDGHEPNMYGGGFAYVKARNTAHEIFNFREVAGRMYGNAPIPWRTINGKPTEVTLRIERLGTVSANDSVKGVLVIWTAPMRDQQGRQVVGWYRDATVYRTYRAPTGKLAARRTFRQWKGGSFVAGYITDADATGCRVLLPNERTFTIPPRAAGQTGLPGMASQFYLSERMEPEAKALAQDLRKFVASVSAGQVSALPPGRSDGRQVDIERRMKIEKGAVDLVWLHFERRGYKMEDRQELDFGYDLFATKDDESLCIEVKGRSLDGVMADFSPNEYGRILDHQSGCFDHGEYRICIVTDALGERSMPLLHHYRWIKRGRGGRWHDGDSGRTLTFEPIIAARGSAD